MNKRKITFFISLKSVKFTDLSKPEKGNPGIGATQFMFVLIASQLTLKYSEEMEILFLTDVDCKLPSNLEVKIVEDEFKAVSYSKKNKADLLIIRTSIEAELYSHINKIEQKVIVWSHNKIWGETVNIIASTPYVVRNICVGVRQALELVDHDIYKKTEVIFNPIMIPNQIEREIEKPTVTYIGHIEKSRGFHILAKIWKDVLKAVPDAQLNVIGSAALYDRNTKLGSLGIATEKYEREFKKYIVSSEGELLPSVNFLGIVGQEKNMIYKKTAVGVINPIGYETLGVSGLEMAACGVPVVTVNKSGQSEIVIHNKTGFLFNNINEFRKYVIELLINTELNNNFSEEARKNVDNSYNIDGVLHQWRCEFELILDNHPPKQERMNNLSRNRGEMLRIFNARIKRIKYFYWIPSILELQSYIRRLYKIMRK